MALLYLIQEYQNRNMISLWLCPQSALCVYGCVYTHILKWRGHWEGAGGLFLPASPQARNGLCWDLGMAVTQL